MTSHTDPIEMTMMPALMVETLDGVSVESEKTRLVEQVASLSVKERAELVAATEKHARSDEGAATIEELSPDDLSIIQHTDPAGMATMSISILETLDERTRLVEQVASLSAEERAVVTMEKHARSDERAATIEELSLDDWGVTPHTDPVGMTMMSASIVETLDKVGAVNERIKASIGSKKMSMVEQVASLSAEKRAAAATEKHVRSEEGAMMEKNERREFRRPGDEDSTPAEFTPFMKIVQPTSQVISTTDAAADRLPTIFYQPQG